MFYVFHGDDTFSLKAELLDLVSKLGDPQTADLNTVWLQGQTTTWEELIQHCDTIPLLSDRRLIIVTGLLARLAQRSKNEAENKLLNDLVTYLTDMPSTTRLVFAEEIQLPDTHPLLILAHTHKDGYAKAFTKPTGNTLVHWVQQRTKQAGGEIDSHTAQMLCAYVEDDLYALDQEIQKLVAYTNGERRITEQDIELLTPRAHQANIFHMVDALGKRDGHTASRIYHSLLDMGSHPLSLLGMIARQFRLMIQVKELAPRLGTAQAIARELRQNPYPIQKILSQSNNYTTEQLRYIYHKMLDTDTDIKTGRIEPTLALDLLIAGLSRVV